MSALRGQVPNRSQFGLLWSSAFNQTQRVAESKRQLPRPPYNPGVRDLIEGKRRWDARANKAHKRAGFRGWHERGYLPHRDSPGLTQFITYHLADAFPAELLGEWAALLNIEEDRQRRKELEQYLDKGRANAGCGGPKLQIFARPHFGILTANDINSERGV
jgi:hypothetical protein